MKKGHLGIYKIAEKWPLLNGCHDFEIGVGANPDLNSHPDQDLIKSSITTHKVKTRIETLLARNGPIIGDIAPWYLYYLEEFLKYSNVKVLALERNKQETIDSFEKIFSPIGCFPWLSLKDKVDNKMRKFLGRARDNNDDASDDTHEDICQSKYNNCYPKFKIQDFLDFSDKDSANKDKDYDLFYDMQHVDVSHINIKDGAMLYYDDYYEKVSKLIEKYGEGRIMLVDSFDLEESEESRVEVLEFLGYRRKEGGFKLSFFKEDEL